MPIAGNFYYVDSPTATTNHYYTSSAVVGNNRNTGKTPFDPKADILPVLHSYNVGPNDYVLIDSGDYVEVRNVVLSGAPSIGRGQGATFMGPASATFANQNDPESQVAGSVAPVDPNFPSFARPTYASTMTATLDRQNTYNQSSDIELNQGSFITLAYLTLTGAQTGLWVHDGSTNFTGLSLIAQGNAGEGIRIESDAPEQLRRRPDGLCQWRRRRRHRHADRQPELQHRLQQRRRRHRPDQYRRDRPHQRPGVWQCPGDLGHE